MDVPIHIGVIFDRAGRYARSRNVRADLVFLGCLSTCVRVVFSQRIAGSSAVAGHHRRHNFDGVILETQRRRRGRGHVTGQFQVSADGSAGCRSSRRTTREYRAAKRDLINKRLNVRHVSARCTRKGSLTHYRADCRPSGARAAKYCVRSVAL